MKVCIALFAYGGIAAECLQCHLDLLAGIIKGNLPTQMFTIREDALISRSRCRATGQFMATECDVLVMLDHDIQFSPADVYALADLAFTHQAVIGIPYPKRKLGAASACRPAEIPPVSVPTLMQVQYLGGGCMAVPRGTLERTIRFCRAQDAPLRIDWCKDTICDFWSLWQPFPLQSGASCEYLSEDWAFCERATRAGVPIMAWAGPVLTHWGMHGFKLLQRTQPEPVKLASDLTSDAPDVPWDGRCSEGGNN